MDAKVVWKGGLSFDGSAETGFTLPLGADPSVGGANDGFRPMELFLIGLAGCTGMDVASILKKKQQVVTAFEVRVHADKREEMPRIFTAYRVEYVVTGKGIDPKAVERAVELSSEKYCPAQALLRQTGPIETQITILEG